MAPKVKKSGNGSKSKVKPSNEPQQGKPPNTAGIITPQPDPNLSGGPTKVPPKPETPKEKGFFEKLPGRVQDKIDAGVEMAGGGTAANIAGAVATAVNQVFVPGAWYEIIPVGKVIKFGKKGVDAIKGTDKAADTVQDAQKANKAQDKTQDANKAKDRDGGNKKGKKKLDCGELGKYGDQKKRTGDNKYDRDHVPSKAALKERAEQIAKDRGDPPLSPKQKKAIENLADAVVIPKSTHRNSSPSYGSKNKKLSKKDGASAEKLNEALDRDLEAVLADLEKTDPECAKQYRAAAKKLRDKIKKNSNHFDDFLNDILDNF